MIENAAFSRKFAPWEEYLRLPVTACSLAGVLNAAARETLRRQQYDPTPDVVIPALSPLASTCK